MNNSSAKSTCDPNTLLDAVIDKLNLKNDAALSRRLHVRPPVISKIRYRRLPVSAPLLIRMHEETGLSIGELRLLMGDQEGRSKSTRPKSPGLATRSQTLQRDAKAVVRDQSLPAWTEGLEIQIAKVLIWKGFENKGEVQAALDRDERIDRIGPTRLARLQTWLNS